MPQWQHPADPNAQQPTHGQQQGYYFPPQNGQGGGLSAYVPAPAHAQQAQHPHQQAPHPGWPTDPRAQQAAYDFANYGTHGTQPSHPGYLQPGGHAPGQGGYPAEPAFDHGHAVAHYAQPHGGQHHGLPAPLQADPHAPHDGQEEFDDGEYEDEEAPGRGRRTLMLVAGLVGAIAIGGGLAYGYKTFGGGFGKPPASNASQPPKAKIALNPAPERRGEKLSEPVAQVASAGSDAGAISGPRPVQTISISPPGASPPAQAAGPSPVRPTVSVPGVMLDNSMNAMAPPARPLPPVQPPQVAPPQQLAVAQPAPVARPQPKPVPLAAAEAPAAPVQKKAPVPPQKVARAADAFSPGGAAPSQAPAAAPTGGNGFVAVLSSQKSRMDALKVYADLQQKYGDVLSNKPADVMERDLGQDKGGTWYRAVVGPPGSRESASGLCAQLKAAGFTGCWVTAY